MLPDFGGEVAHLPQPCSPSELYRALHDADQHVHYFEPAFTLVLSLLESRDLPAASTEATTADDFIGALLHSARSTLVAVTHERCAASWPARIAREFAPVGLADGVWLQGLTAVAQIEDELGMAALTQLMVRCGDPGTSEAYAERYASLLRSVGVVPASITRWELPMNAPCADISYEQALFGMALALFPSALRPEIVGFNLWMASVGPCPLLEQVAADLRRRKANLTYLDGHDRPAMEAGARRMVELLFPAGGDVSIRIARGFHAAHRSYLRWQEAVCGANVPMSPRECVVEMIGRKAQFALGHHARIRLDGKPLEGYFRGGRAAHEILVAKLAASPLVQPGDPARSRLVNEAISIDGPMFDIFTASEQQDLCEWIAGIGTEPERGRRPPIPLAGVYGLPQDPDSLREYALRRFDGMAAKELLFHLVNADQCPPVRVFGARFVERALGRVRTAFESDERLRATKPLAYSEQSAAELLVVNHERNVRSQRFPGSVATPQAVMSNLLDGCWLQGFADVQRAGLEEYGWLFRIYASEMGDGRLSWNHNYIARQMFCATEPRVMLPATDRRLYESVESGPIAVLYMSMALNTARFLPELLGLNLAIEAKGVCGSFVSTWKAHERKGEPWYALYHRLHNSIDNYASGHTKWSLAALQAFMARVQAVAPEAMDGLWRRAWCMWRLLEIQAHGTPAEIEALHQQLRPATVSPMPPPEAAPA